MMLGNGALRTTAAAGGANGLTPEFGMAPLGGAIADRAGSFSGMAPRPGRLPPLQHAGAQRLAGDPPAAGGGSPQKPGSFSFQSVSSISAASTPVFEPQQAPSPFAPSPSQKRREAMLEMKGEVYEQEQGLDAMVLSMGQISLHDTLLNRAARLREDLMAQLGRDALEAACRVVAAAHARATARGFDAGAGADAGADVDMMGADGAMDTRALHDDLARVLGPQAVQGDAGADLMAWIDELVFLESRKQAARAWV